MVVIRTGHPGPEIEVMLSGDDLKQAVKLLLVLQVLVSVLIQRSCFSALGI